MEAQVANQRFDDDAFEKSCIGRDTMRKTITVNVLDAMGAAPFSESDLERIKSGFQKVLYEFFLVKIESVEINPLK